jgi:hypothetical protein
MGGIIAEGSVGVERWRVGPAWRLRRRDRGDGPRDIQVVEAGNGAKVTVVINVNGEDAARLDELAAERGQGVDEVVAELVRNA